MGSQVIKVLRQGVWGSLTGGWYYDPGHSKFTNIFHLYAWIILLCLPFIFYIAFVPSWAVVVLYLVTLLTLFSALKITNFRLHSMFDHGEVVSKKEVSPETNDPTIQQVSEERENAVDQGLQEIIPVAGATAGPRSGDGDTLGQQQNQGQGDMMAGGGVTVEEVVDVSPIEGLKVDVHMNSTPSEPKVELPEKDSTKTDKKVSPQKQRAKKRRKRSSKTVVFAESAVIKAKPLIVGRCASLSSATDSDTTDDERSSSSISSSDDTEISDAEEKGQKSFHASSRPIKRRVGIRGKTKHPWYQKPRDGFKTSFDEQEAGDLDGITSISSVSSDEWSHIVENNNVEKSTEESRKGAQRPTRRRRDSGDEDRSTSSPHRKLPAMNRNAEDTGQKPVIDPEKFAQDKSAEKIQSETEKELATSDQELLSRDPVWRARKSSRYSSDHRLFFRRRRSYAVSFGVHRHSERDTRRRTPSTVPPYTGRRRSPLRTPPVSAVKLWSTQSSKSTRPSNRRIDPPSPGEVSPGQVPNVSVFEDAFSKYENKQSGTETTMNNPDERSASVVKYVDADRAAVEVVSLDDDLCDSVFPPLNKCKDRGDGLGRSSEHHGVVRHVSEASSHNSNPHCNELSATGDKRLSGSLTPINLATLSAERKKNRLKRQSLEDPVKNNKLDLFFDPPLLKHDSAQSGRPPTPMPRLEDSEDDMIKFIDNLLGAADMWQGDSNKEENTGQTISTALEPETTSASLNLKRKLPDYSDKCSEEVSIPGLAQDQEPSSSDPKLRRPRHSFPTMISSQTNDDASQLEGRARLASAPQGGSGGSRRVRHPAGSNTRLASNTSEEAGGNAVAAPLQQLSANSLNSTTELLSNTRDDTYPLSAIAKLEEEDPRIHIATEHNDTTEGAIHAFQDELGNWHTYTFGEQSQGVASSLGGDRSTRGTRRQHSRPSWPSGDTSDSTKSPAATRRERRITLPSVTHRLALTRQGRPDRFFEGSDGSGSFYEPNSPGMTPLDFILNTTNMVVNRPQTPRVKLYYKFNFLPCKSIILQYDRLALHDLLDRNRRILENIFAIFMVLLVALLGFLLLWRGFFYDIWPLWFCTVIATCQYSLVRSVQPDSASPMHGHNRIIAYSRPIYFCLIALLILFFDHIGNSSTVVPNVYFYGNLYFTQSSCILARNILIVLIMTLPFIFLVGLLPQINTFLIYMAEQVDVHMFGGTACSGLLASAYSFARSLTACCILFGFSYGAMKTEEGSKHILFSIFCGLLISVSYHLSRQTTDPLHLWTIVKSKFFPESEQSASVESGNDQEKDENPDDLSSIYVKKTLAERLQSDLIICPLTAIFMFAIHCSTAFKVLQPSISIILYIIAAVIGILTHYVLPQLRKQLPWLLFSSPVLKAKEYHLFEVQEEAQVMWFEKLYIWLCYLERNILYPIIMLNEVTRDAAVVVDLYGLIWGSFILCFVGLKLVRSAYCVTLLQFATLAFSALYTHYDARGLQDPNLITYFLFSIFIVKVQEMVLKLQFILVYIAPWQITWGSAFHAFAQPFSVPHSGMLLLHTAISSLLHAPLAPFLGSAVFLTSYIRPIKFWERNYKTKRIDHSNTRLSAQIDRGPSTDDNNLNSIFYEHLTLSLQKSLSGDVAMGRWGNVYPGDCFIMASDYLNALVHVIQRGNGVLTFQLRGLEFGGTYCQQREVEAITEGVDDNYGLCCFRPGRIKNMLSVNSALSQRWLAWQVQSTKYVVDGYSITDNSATSMLGVYDLRKILISYMVKSVIYFLVSHKSLEKWLAEETILSATADCEASDYVDTDTTFSVTIHDDYDMCLSGISRNKFQLIYGEWITYCATQREVPVESGRDSKLVSLCYLISLLSRRALGTASSPVTTNHVVVLESFLYGLHSLFKGDFRITSPKDEWVFSDMDLLHHVVAPGVRMSLKLHQDHFQSSDEENDLAALHSTISDYVTNMVITHEGDPAWRRAVLSNSNSLLALRHHAGDTVDSYFVIALKRRSLGFRIVRVNKECVKGLWAGQQQELVFLRNRNPERGSIQNAKQVLRNMINSSCDQPIGYPIYVSPVTTSFSNTHPQYKKIVGGSMSLQSIRRILSSLWSCIQQSCGAGCNSGGSAGISIADQARFRPSIARPPMPPLTARISAAGSTQASSIQSNVAPSLNEPISINRMIRNSSSQAPQSSSGPRRHVRSNTEDYGSGNVFLSSSSIPGRSSLRWRAGSDNMKPIPSRHLSAAGSIEMSSLGMKGPKIPRDSRREGGGSITNSDIILLKASRSSLPTDEAGAHGGQPLSAGGSQRIHKSGNGITATSSTSSSVSRGDSSTVICGQVFPSKNPRKSSRDSESDARSSVLEPKIGSQKERENEKPEKELVKITDPSRVFENLEVKRRQDHVMWPNEEWRSLGGKEKWKNWKPVKGTVGEVVYRWYPSHRNAACRSHVGEVIVLLKVENPSEGEKAFYVPLPEGCIAALDDAGRSQTTQF